MKYFNYLLLVLLLSSEISSPYSHYSFKHIQHTDFLVDRVNSEDSFNVLSGPNLQALNKAKTINGVRFCILPNSKAFFESKYHNYEKSKHLKTSEKSLSEESYLEKYKNDLIIAWKNVSNQSVFISNPFNMGWQSRPYTGNKTHLNRSLLGVFVNGDFTESQWMEINSWPQSPHLILGTTLQIIELLPGETYYRYINLAHFRQLKDVSFETFHIKIAYQNYNTEFNPVQQIHDDRTSSWSKEVDYDNKITLPVWTGLVYSDPIKVRMK